MSTRFVQYAAKSAAYVLVSLSDRLPNARRLVASAPLELGDGGDGGDLTVGVSAATSVARGVLRLAGQLGGTADAPDVRGLRITGDGEGEGPQLLSLGHVKDGEVLKRAGATLVGAGVATLDGGGRLGATQAPLKSVYAIGGNQAMVPGDIGAAPSGRMVSTGTGLAGGGDLSVNRTFSIASFTGIVSKDFDPNPEDYTIGQEREHFIIDVGAAGLLMPFGLRLPPEVSGVRARIYFILDNNDALFIENASSSNPLDEGFQGLMSFLAGGVDAAAQRNGRCVQKLALRTYNASGSAQTGVNLGEFRVRAWASPRGGGSALAP